VNGRRLETKEEQMKSESTRQAFLTKVLFGAVVLLLCATQGFAIFGVWRRHARRWAVVGTTVAVSSAAAHSAAAAQQSAAATSAAQSAAASSQASAAAAQEAAASAAAAKSAAPATTAQKTPQQKLEELDSLYKQGLISEGDYNAAKTKILAEITQ
jgi:putative oligomerization/nucleic acid binding protein